MLRTQNGLPKFCSWNTDRHGTRRVRFRKGSFSTYLTGIPYSEDFLRQYAAALEGVQAQTSNVGASRTIPGSFDALVISFYRGDFQRLKPSTQRLWRNIIERLRSEHGSKPIARLERSHIKNIISAKAATPSAANNLLKVLRVLLSYAVDIGMIQSNDHRREALQGPRRRVSHLDRKRDRPLRGTPSDRQQSTACIRIAALYGAASLRRNPPGLAACRGRHHRTATRENRHAAPDPDPS